MRVNLTHSHVQNKQHRLRTHYEVRFVTSVEKPTGALHLLSILLIRESRSANQMRLPGRQCYNIFECHATSSSPLVTSAVSNRTELTVVFLCMSCIVHFTFLMINCLHLTVVNYICRIMKQIISQGLDILLFPLMLCKVLLKFMVLLQENMPMSSLVSALKWTSSVSENPLLYIQILR